MNIELGTYALGAIKNIGTPKCPDNLKEFAYQMFMAHPDLSIERIRTMWANIQHCGREYNDG